MIDHNAETKKRETIWMYLDETFIEIDKNDPKFKLGKLTNGRQHASYQKDLAINHMNMVFYGATLEECLSAVNKPIMMIINEQEKKLRNLEDSIIRITSDNIQFLKE